MPSNKRILFAITDLEVGGVPLHLLRLARSLKRQDWHVDVVSLIAGGEVEARLREDGISVHTCDAGSAIDWRVIERLAQIIETRKPDVVHSMLFHANLACRLACLLNGFPRSRLICEIQTVEIERHWHLWVDRILYRLSRVTVCNSNSVRDHLHRRAGIPMNRLNVIAGGVDVDSIANAKPHDTNQWRRRDGEALLLWVGRMDPIKGLDTLIDAIAFVSKKRAVQLLLIGDGPEYASIEARVIAQSLQQSVHFLGVRSDVDRLMRSADLFVFPSRTEGMPNALLEAMAGKLPIVATDVPGCRDLVAQGNTGRLVKVNDPQALANAIDTALNDKVTTEAMSANAWHYVSQHHSATACHQAYASLYESAAL